MIKPCKSCPWKKSTRTEDIPGGGMDHVQACRAEGRWGGIVMACHLTTDDRPGPCAGWVERVAKPLAWSSGEQALPMRMLLITARVDLREFTDGGEALHKTMAAMLAAHPDPNE